MIEPERHGLRSARLALNWYRWGPAGAPTLILVHGGRDHARSWDAAARRFAGPWQVVAPDLRGHGLSGWSDGGAYQMDDFAYDLHRLAETLDVSAERPATIVGHSLGGAIALRWTAAFPDRVRRLVVIEGLGLKPEADAAAEARPLPPDLADWIARRARREDRDLPLYATLAAAEARMAEVNPRFPPDLVRHLTLHGTRAVEGGWRFAYDPLLLAWAARETSGAQRLSIWRAVTCPVMLMVGQESWASDPARDGRAAAFRDARVVSVPGAGHWLHHDRPEVFLAEVAGFVD